MPRSPAAPQPTGAARDNAPETGDNPYQATPPPSADGDHLPVIEPSYVRVTVDATTDDTEPVPDGSASAIGGRDTITDSLRRDPSVQQGTSPKGRRCREHRGSLPFTPSYAVRGPLRALRMRYPAVTPGPREAVASSERRAENGPVPSHQRPRRCQGPTATQTVTARQICTACGDNEATLPTELVDLRRLRPGM